MTPALWRELMVRIEESWELLDEVKDLDIKVQMLTDQLAQRDAELDIAHAQLAYEISRRTLGGTPPKPTKKWKNTHAKFKNNPPPPHKDVA